VLFLFFRILIDRYFILTYNVKVNIKEKVIKYTEKKEKDKKLCG